MGNHPSNVRILSAERSVAFKVWASCLVGGARDRDHAEQDVCSCFGFCTELKQLREISPAIMQKLPLWSR